MKYTILAVAFLVVGCSEPEEIKEPTVCNHENVYKIKIMKTVIAYDGFDDRVFYYPYFCYGPPYPTQKENAYSWKPIERSNFTTFAEGSYEQAEESIEEFRLDHRDTYYRIKKTETEI